MERQRAWDIFFNLLPVAVRKMHALRRQRCIQQQHRQWLRTASFSGLEEAMTRFLAVWAMTIVLVVFGQCSKSQKTKPAPQTDSVPAAADSLKTSVAVPVDTTVFDTMATQSPFYFAWRLSSLDAQEADREIYNDKHNKIAFTSLLDTSDTMISRYVLKKEYTSPPGAVARQFTGQRDMMDNEPLYWEQHAKGCIVSSGNCSMSFLFDLRTYASALVIPPDSLDSAGLAARFGPPSEVYPSSIEFEFVPINKGNEDDGYNFEAIYLSIRFYFDEMHKGPAVAASLCKHSPCDR